MSLRPKSATPLILLGIVAVACWIVEAIGVRLNLTPSLPRGIYKIERGRASLGDLVAVCLPESYGAFGRERGYVGHGACPGRAAPLLKRIGAVGGDHLEITADGVLVNGQLLQGPAPAVDSQGRALDPLPARDLVLARGEVWVFAPHPRSWDSRFFGPLPVASLRGRVRPLWVAKETAAGSLVPAQDTAARAAEGEPTGAAQ